MIKWDVNCWIGTWPFRSSHYSTLDDLQKTHRANGISHGFVGSLQSVFWADPMRAEEALSAALQGSGYDQICTANPALPGVEAYLDEAVERFSVRGVRICPGYHGYRLDDACVEPLHRALVRHGLPLFLTVQLEDPRLSYIAAARELELPELRAAAARFSDVKLVCSFIQSGDLVAMEDLFRSCANLYADTSGFRGPAGALEYVLEHIDPGRLLYGSAHTLYTLRSSLSCIEQARVPDAVKEQILGENARRFFS